MAEQETAALRMRLFQGPLPGQLARFAVVGASNTALTWCVFAASTALGAWYPAAAAFAFALGAVNGYTLNRVWTFRAGGFDSRALGRYVVIQIGAMLTNVGLVVALVEGFALHRLLAQLVAIPIVSMLSFGASRNWAFSPLPAPR